MALPVLAIPYLWAVGTGVVGGLWLRSEFDSDSKIGLGAAIVGGVALAGSLVVYKRFLK